MDFLHSAGSEVNHNITEQRRHNEHDGVSNHQPQDCLLNRLFGRWTKKTSKLRVTGFVRGELTGHRWIPHTKASNSEKVSICWHHHQ